MIKRDIAKRIQEVASTFRVLMVTGPRQVGKTTIMKSLLPEGMNYVTLDDEALRLRAKTDPIGFLDEHPWPLMIDEAQYAPELFPYIKMRVDEAGEKSMYWLSGSQQFSLMKNVQESLAGRVGIVEMNSFTYSEIHALSTRPFNPADLANITSQDQAPIDVNELFATIYQGGMPELYTDNAPSKKDFFEAYVKTYITRDVEGILNIKDHRTFLKFMKALARYNGEQLNYSNIANAAGISDKTVRSWVDVLLTSGVVYLLEPYYHSTLARISHTPKLYFMDQGLASYLEGWQSPRDLQLSERAGQYFEAFIISELVKSYRNHGEDKRLYYFRDDKQAEIDLLIEQNVKLYPFEIKKTGTPKPDMLKHFDAFRTYAKNVETGGLICLYDKPMHLTATDFVIPAASVILAK